MKKQNTLFTPAWLMKGMSQSMPGILFYDGHNFGFEADDDKFSFRQPLQEIKDIKFPWYYFGGGFKASAGNHSFRISLVRPNGADQVSKRVVTKIGQLTDNLGLETFGIVSGLSTIIESADSIREGRTAMKQWKEFFSRN